MKRIIFSILLLFVIVFSIFAEGKTLQISTTVPEDFGVVFPEEALRLDRLVLAMEASSGDRSFLKEDGNIDAGSIEEHPDGITLKFFYYGNLSYPYSVIVKADSGSGFLHDVNDETETIPMNTSFIEPAVVPVGVSLDIYDSNTVGLTVSQKGAVSAMEVLNLRIAWDNTPDFLPGEYIADLSLTLSVV